ncbi:hypothetical protein FPV67DRAFT_1511031 [Lyophyllum atratum]|nr:hypothetical protein FPV67DRAFT_1511031 [Lyophyllum atratum]
MKFSSAILFTLPVVLASWTAVAEPTVAARDLAQLTRNNLVARHTAEWDVYRRDFEPETLSARRTCVTSKDCLGMICIKGICK